MGIYDTRWCVTLCVRYMHGHASVVTLFFVFKIFYCGSQNHIHSTYIYTYSLSPEVSRNTNLIIAQFICNTVQRQVSSNRQIITLTYIMLFSTNHSMCTFATSRTQMLTDYHTILTTL